jgi:hypothetical protein
MIFTRRSEPPGSAARVRLGSVATAIGLVVVVMFAYRAEASPPVVTLTRSVVWAELDANVLHGRLSRLAWSDDRSTVYLQTVEGKTPETLTFHHYVVRKGGPLVSLDAQPEWVGVYWKWKSAKRFAGDPSLTIEVDTRKEMADNLNGIAATKSVYLTDSVIGLSGQDLTLAKQSGGSRLVNRLLLKGHIIGEFIDEVIAPGYTFSWSPEDLRLIAYRGPSGRLTIMNDEGQTTTVSESKDVLLPAWSDDGAAIAYIERTRRFSSARLSLRVVEVIGR